MPDSGDLQQGSAVNGGNPGEQAAGQPFVDKFGVGVWPSPPLFRLLPPARDEAFTKVTVISRHLSRQEGRLIRFIPQLRKIQLQERGSPVSSLISYDDVELMTALKPVPAERQDHLIASLGAADQGIDVPRRFELRFAGGDTMKGLASATLVQDGALFLFESITGGALLRHFVPLSSLQSYSIGEPLADLLAKDGVSRGAIETAQQTAAESRPLSLDGVLERFCIVNRVELDHALEQARNTPTRPLGAILSEMRLVSPEQLDRALQFQKSSHARQLGEVLVELGALDAEKLKRARAWQIGIPFVDLYKLRPDPGAVRAVAARTAAQLHVMPVLLEGEVLVAAVADPFDSAPLDQLRFACGRNVIPVMATHTQIDDCVLRYYEGISGEELRTVEGAPRMDDIPYAPVNGPRPIHALADQLVIEGFESGIQSREPSVSETDTTLVRFVNTMILDAYHQGASDIHIETMPGEQPSRVRFRRDGVLDEYIQIPASFRNAVVTRLKIMADLDISEHRHGQDGKIQFSRFGPAAIELRVAIVPTSNGLEDVVMRLLMRGKLLPMEALDIAPAQLDRIKAMMRKPQGIVLACGPTGSGKTSTLHALLGHINTPDRKIWTAEDPVEITQPGLRQVQIQPKIGWDFASTLRSFLRADPDVIMVGEMRDQETARIAIEASLTGHLVLSTLHTNGAVESVARLLEMGMDRFNLSDALLGLVAQRLARRLCTACRVARSLGDSELNMLAEEYGEGANLDADLVLASWRARFAQQALVIHEPKGCAVCDGKGYRGRVGLFEVLEVSESFRHLIREAADSGALKARALADGMTLLRQDGIDKALAGLTSIAEVRAACG